MSDERKQTERAFAATVQGDMRRERRLLVAEIAILAVLLALAGLRYWAGP